MASSPEFVEHVLDLLAPLGAVQARRLFGGHGVYAQGVMFGLIDQDELFLKTDAGSRPRFVEAGCRSWVYGPMRETSYFRPPDEAHEDPAAMLPWARLALDAALRVRAGRRQGSRRTARASGNGGPADAASGVARAPRSGSAAPVSVRRAAQPTPAQRRRPGRKGTPPTGPRRPR